MLNNKNWDNIPGFDSNKGQFKRLNLEDWLAQHDIVENGRRRGEENQPPENQNLPDGTEGQIIAWINHRGRVCHQNVSAYLSDRERDLTDLENDEELLSLADKVREIERDGEFAMERSIREGEDYLVEPREALTDCLRGFTEFRKESGLTNRRADYSKKKTSLTWIWGCFGVEVLLNATLLMDVSAFGLLGSITQMGLISAANILIFGLFMGAALRLRNHVNTEKKAFAWSAIVVLLGVVGAFNTVIGHFRDSMQAILDDPSADILTLGNDALARLGASPFGFESFQSLLLAVFGVLFFAVASWKWFQCDDPYPDYGRRDRELKAKRKDYSSAYDRALTGLSQVSNSYIERLEDIRHSLTAKQTRWREICLQGERILEEYPVQLAQYQDDLNYLLEKYREANLESRSDPAPSYFGTRENVDPEILMSPSFRPPVQQKIKAVTMRVAEAIENLQRKRGDAGSAFPNVEAVCSLT